MAPAGVGAKRQGIRPRSGDHCQRQPRQTVTPNATATGMQMHRVRSQPACRACTSISKPSSTHAQARRWPACVCASLHVARHVVCCMHLTVACTPFRCLQRLFACLQHEHWRDKPWTRQAPACVALSAQFVDMHATARAGSMTRPSIWRRQSVQPRRRAQEAVARASQEAATSGLTGKELSKHNRKLRIADRQGSCSAVRFLDWTLLVTRFFDCGDHISRRRNLVLPVCL